MPEEKWQVLLPKEIDDSGPDSIADIAEFTNIGEFGTSPAELAPHVEPFDAIILRTAVLDRDVIEAAENLEVISKHGVGLDNVDIPAATENGIVVCNTPGANSRAVGEHAVTLLCAANRHLAARDDDVRAGDWKRHDRIPVEFGGRTLGLFGCGNIGSVVAGIAGDGFGMEVLAFDPYVSQEELPDGVEKVGKDELFERSEAISVHTPLTDETHHAVGGAELARLDGGIVVNTSRGPVIDEAALVDALDSGDVIAAGLDVFESEPPEEDNPLLTRDDVVLSPHVGGLTGEAFRNMSMGAAEHVRDVYEGRMPETAVNADDLD